MEQIVPLFDQDPVTFVYIPVGSPGYQMSKSVFDGASVVLYKAKRKRHMLVKDGKLSFDLVSDALGGGGTWQASSGLEFRSINDEL